MGSGLGCGPVLIYKVLQEGLTARFPENRGKMSNEEIKPLEAPKIPDEYFEQLETILESINQLCGVQPQLLGEHGNHTATGIEVHRRQR